LSQQQGSRAAKGGFDSIQSKKVVFHKMQVQKNLSRPKENALEMIHNFNYSQRQTQRQTRSSTYSLNNNNNNRKQSSEAAGSPDSKSGGDLKGRASGRQGGGSGRESAKSLGKSWRQGHGAGTGRQTSPADDVLSAIERIEGLIQNNPNKQGGVRNKTPRTRSRAQMDPPLEGKPAKNPKKQSLNAGGAEAEDLRLGLLAPGSNDQEEDFMVDSSQRVTYGVGEGLHSKKRAKPSASLASDGDFAKRLLCNAVNVSNSRKGSVHKKADELKDFGFV